MKRVTGIGGIFFKTQQPDKLKEWYSKHLGIPSEEFGTVFNWKDEENNRNGYTVWSPFPASTEYFKPSDKDFMINYIVDDIESLAVELKNEEVEIIGDVQVYPYGKFLHIVDIEGNKIELWEPNYDFKP